MTRSDEKSPFRDLSVSDKKRSRALWAAVGASASDVVRGIEASIARARKAVDRVADAADAAGVKIPIEGRPELPPTVEDRASPYPHLLGAYPRQSRPAAADDYLGLTPAAVVGLTRQTQAWADAVEAWSDEQTASMLVSLDARLADAAEPLASVLGATATVPALRARMDATLAVVRELRQRIESIQETDR